MLVIAAYVAQESTRLGIEERTWTTVSKKVSHERDCIP